MSRLTATAHGALADSTIHRRADQFTALYVLAPWLRQAMHAFNHVWFRFVRLPRRAFANILVVEKRA